MQASPVAVPVPAVFEPAEAAFAFAWRRRIKGKWAVFLDAADDGAEYLTVETPDSGAVSYHVLPLDGGAVSANLDHEDRSPPVYPSLCAFLLSIVPLSDEDFKAADAEALGFCTWDPAATV